MNKMLNEVINISNLFNIHGSIGINNKIESFQKQFENQIQFPNPDKEIKFSIISIFLPGEGDKMSDLKY